VVIGLGTMEGVGLMRFTPTLLDGACIVDIEPVEDERGMFARSWCPEQFSRQGLDPRIAACNISFNRAAGTLRGLHYQAPPHEEAKLVRCTAGAIFDVIVDIRPASSTFRKWFGIELTAQNRTSLYVPAGFAHGFQTLEDSSEVFYIMSTPYVHDAARGVRWDDPAFAIEWPPADQRVISPRDLSFDDFALEPHGSASSAETERA
jgi:dTDP-4-dehydrorhamnose 3,5-epimerase